MADPRALPIPLSDADRAILRSRTRRRSTAQGLALRARIVLACAEPGTTHLAVAARLGISNLTVGKWRRRFAEQGIEGLADAPRPRVSRRILDEHIERVITTTLESTPRNATHWSTRLLARQLGMSQNTISRIWRAFTLAPHRSETFKLSTDPHFIDKVRLKASSAALGLGTSGIAIKPIGFGYAAQPPGRHRCQFVERSMQRLCHQFKQVQFAHCPQHVGAVGALAAPGPDQAARLEVALHLVQQEVLDALPRPCSSWCMRREPQEAFTSAWMLLIKATSSRSVKRVRSGVPPRRQAR